MLNSSPIDELGNRCLTGRQGGLSTSGTARRYPWQPCEWEPPLHAAATWHRHTEMISVERKILTSPYTFLNPRITRAGRAGSKNP